MPSAIGSQTVARLRELGAQQRGGVGLGEELRLEIEARREVEVRVRRPRVAVDAAVLAALVRIDRLRERDVGRIVAAMIVRACWMRTIVLSGGGASSSPSAASPARPSRRRPLRAARGGSGCRIERRAAALGRRGGAAMQRSSRQDASAASIVTVIDGDSAREMTQLTLAFDAISANCAASIRARARA